MAEEVSDFFKEMRLAITERWTSPLVGTYWISWFIWNFKFVLIVFSGEAIESKFVLIHDEMFWGFWGYVSTYCGPALMTALFIFAYPRPAEIVYEYRLKYQQKLNAIRQKEENHQLLSMEEVRQHRLDMREKERKMKQNLDEMEKEVSDLREENDALKARSIRTPEPAQIPNKSVPGSEYDYISGVGDYSPLEVGVLAVVSSHFPDMATQDDLLKRMNDLKFPPEISKSRIKIMDAVDSLIREGLLKKGEFYDGTAAYSLTERGRDTALEFDL